MNIGGISYYSSELKFVDIAKQSQSWITERTDGAHAHEWDTHEESSVHWRNDGYPADLPGAKPITIYEPRHAKRVFRVILIKMFIFQFSECPSF